MELELLDTEEFFVLEKGLKEGQGSNLNVRFLVTIYYVRLFIKVKKCTENVPKNNVREKFQWFGKTSFKLFY
jgi:hypothetical protein